MLRRRRRLSYTPLVIALLAITVTSCGTDGDAQPTGGTTSTDPASAAPTDPPTTTVGPSPTRFAAVTSDGESSVVYEFLDGAWTLLRTDPSPAGAVATAILLGSEVIVSTCCEPASGTRWSIESGVREIGRGTTTDASADSAVWVDPNAGAITVESREATRVITSSSGRTPTDAALGPTGTIAVISFGDGDRYSVHIVDPAGTNFDTTDAIYETSLHLEAVSIAADGAIWVLEGDGDPTTDDNVQIAIDADTRQSQSMDAEPLVDQTFDAAGVHLIVASAKGAVLLRDADTGRLVDTGVSGLDHVDW